MRAALGELEGRIVNTAPAIQPGRDVVLQSRRLSKWFGKGEGLVRAVNEVDRVILVNGDKPRIAISS